METSGRFGVLVFHHSPATHFSQWISETRGIQAELLHSEQSLIRAECTPSYKLCWRPPWSWARGGESYPFPLVSSRTVLALLGCRWSPWMQGSRPRSAWAGLRCPLTGEGVMQYRSPQAPQASQEGKWEREADLPFWHTSEPIGLGEPPLRGQAKLTISLQIFSERERWLKFWFRSRRKRQARKHTLHESTVA